MALIACARTGNVDAANQLAVELRPYIKGLAKRFLRGRSQRQIDVSDVTQDALFDVCSKLEQFLGASDREFHGWIKTIVWHDVLDAVRHASKRPSEDGPDIWRLITMVEGDLLTASWRAILKEESQILHESMDELALEDRELLGMRYFQDVDVAEIARRLDISPDAVAKRLERARKRLGQILRKRLKVNDR